MADRRRQRSTAPSPADGLPRTGTAKVIAADPGATQGGPAPDDGRLAALLDQLRQLPPDEAAWIAARFGGSTGGHAARLAERDAAVQHARRFWAGKPPTAAAHALELALNDYLARVWRREREMAELAAGASEVHRSLHRIARFNNGEPLGRRQIFNLFNGSRGR